MRTDETCDAESRHPRPAECSCHAPGEEGRASIQHECTDECAAECKSAPPPGLPISHILEFNTEAREERHELSARLSSEIGVSDATALAALEAFNMDTTRARQCLLASQPTQQVTCISGLPP